MPTFEQQIEDLKKTVEDLTYENKALNRICDDQARMIRHMNEQQQLTTGRVALDLRQPKG